MPVAGIDIGSLSTEVVILEKGEVLAQVIRPTGADSLKAGEAAMEEALEIAGLQRDEIKFSVATGYGRIRIPGADKRITEITCHGKGAHHLIPETRTIIDIGGQDSKVICINADGKVLDFVMNEKCAAGTGRFLEVMANALEVNLKDMAAMSAKAQQAVPISSMCTVFAESEVVSLIAEGKPREEIIKGLHNSIADRIIGMVRRVGLVEQLTMTGGVAKNGGVVQALEEGLGVKINIPPEPQIVGALGAALLAEEQK